MTCGVKTKFGSATVSPDGYYRIFSKKEGNHGKLLHRLIFEDFYQCDLDEMFPDGVVVHHEDENKLNNAIWNLSLMSRGDHAQLHHKGKVVSDETRQKISNARKGVKLTESHSEKMSESNTSTGFFRVMKQKNKTCKNGFTWAYQYKTDGRKHKMIYSVNLLKLKAKVISKGLKWKIVDEKKANNLCNEFGYDLEEVA